MKKSLFENLSELFSGKSTQDAFDEYLEIRKAYQAVEKEIKKFKKKRNTSSFKLSRLENKKKYLFDKKVKAEKGLVDVTKGLFVGVGVRVNNSLVSDLVPIYLEWKKLVNHYFVYGTSQVGKSRLLANHVRQFILNNWNVIVIDPKGGEGQEILSWVIEFAGEALRPEDLFYIAPVYSDYTDCLNPLYSLENEEIASMVQLLCKGGGTGGGSDNDFFADYAYKVMLAVLYALEFLESVVDVDGRIAQERLNRELVNYYKLLELKGEKTAKYDKLNKIILPDVSTRMSKKHSKNHEILESEFAIDRQLITFKELAYYSNFKNLKFLISSVGSFPVPELQDKKKLARLKYLKKEAIELMRDLKTIEEDFFVKVSTSLTTLLTQLSSGKIGQLLCTVRINPLVNRLYREDKGLICVIQPAPLKFQKVSEMILKIFFKMFESVFGLIGSSGRGMSRRVALLIDEAKTAMYPGIEELYNKAAQLGMTIGGYTQSRADLQYKLGDKLAEVVEDCVNTTFYLRTNSSVAREYIADSFGTVRQHTYNYTAENTLAGGRFMIQTVDEDIAKPHHLKALNVGEGFVHHAKELYKVEFPYQDSPYGAIEMPVLKEEEMITGLTRLEKIIEEKMKDMETVNNEYFEKHGEANAV